MLFALYVAESGIDRNINIVECAQLLEAYADTCFTRRYIVVKCNISHEQFLFLILVIRNMEYCNKD